MDQRSHTGYASQEKAYLSHDETPLDDSSDITASSTPARSWHMEHEVSRLIREDLTKSLC